MSKISICVPIHNMQNGEYFLNRLLQSVYSQTYKNYELIIIGDGTFAENTNSAIRKAEGDIIKILCMDDFFNTKDALQHIVDSFTGGWLASGCTHTKDGKKFERSYVPSWNDQVVFGNNTIGAPSAVSFENKSPLFFNEELKWLVDCEFYHRLYKRYGKPTIVSYIDIAEGIGSHQMTDLITQEEKMREYVNLMEKYG